jgi:cytochrome c peroxidase
MSLIVSSNSKYDDVKNGKSSFTENENQGYELFKIHCINCHTEPLFTNFSYKNNGLDLIPADKGRENITKNPEDRGKFKVPTLRNIDFTYPYMHDGRFSTLSEVLDHYISGIKNSNTTDKQLIGGINITPQQKKYLLSFLRTLNDFKLLGDTLISEPSYKSLIESHK